METFAVLGSKHNEAVSRDLGHSALPDAPVQPYVARRRLGRRAVAAAMASLARWRAARRSRPVAGRVRRAGAGCEPTAG